MDKKELFNEALVSIVEYAQAKDNKLSPDEIKSHFKDFTLDEEQYKFIYDYLASNKIQIKGYEKESADSITVTDIEVFDDEISSKVKESEQELFFIDMYMKELSSVLPAASGEIEQLIDRLCDGDKEALNRLTELHLHKVAEIAKQFRGSGVTFGDLIQEGNMGLMMALSEFEKTSGGFDVYIEDAIRTAIEDAINVQVNADRVGNRLASKLNQLDTATKNLSEKLGRVPEISELAKEMSISEDEVSWLLKTSLDTLSVNEDTQITEEEKVPDTPAEDPLSWRVNKK